MPVHSEIAGSVIAFVEQFQVGPGRPSDPDHTWVCHDGPWPAYVKFGPYAAPDNCDEIIMPGERLRLDRSYRGIVSVFYQRHVI